MDELIILLEHKALYMFNHHTWLGRTLITVSQNGDVERLNGFSESQEELGFRT